MPIEEYGFYLTGFITVLLMYIWADEFWFAAYNIADYPGESRKIPRLLQFHAASVALGIILIAAAIAYKKVLSPAPEGFPGYFTFLVATALIPAAAFFPSARPFINWRAFSLTLFIVVLISLVWEATLALPYGWWGFQQRQMVGLSINAWYSLPIEEVGAWVAVSYATVIIFEVIKLWQASGKKAKHAFCDADRPVGGIKSLVGSQHAAAGTVPLRQVAGAQVGGERRPNPMHGAFEQRRIDDATLAGALALLQCGQRANRAPHARRGVVDRGGAERRRVVGPAGQRHHRGIGLQQRIEAGGHAQRPLIAERPDRAIDQPGIGREHRVGTNAAFIDYARTQILNQDVSVAHQRGEFRNVAGALDVQRDGALAAIDRVKRQRVAIDERRPPKPASSPPSGFSTLISRAKVGKE